MSSIEREFINALLDNCLYENAFRKDLKTPYFDNEYGEYIKKLGLVSKEFYRKNEGDPYPICSLYSSARWSFLDFYYARNAKVSDFEIRINNGLPGGPTVMDVIKDNEYYECKCHEVLSRYGIKFTKTYRDNKLFKEFGFDLNDITRDDGSFTLAAEQFGVKKRENDPKGLRFDVKQLICHLIALANRISNSNGDENAKLQYVIYRPVNYKENKKLKELYDELETEIKAIWSTPQILSFIRNERHIIELPPPEYPDLKQIKDPVFDEVYRPK